MNLKKAISHPKPMHPVLHMAGKATARARRALWPGAARLLPARRQQLQNQSPCDRKKSAARFFGSFRGLSALGSRMRLEGGLGSLMQPGEV